MKQNNQTTIMNFQNIAIMTSGGDSPGMNMTVISLIKFLYSNNIRCKVIYEGIRGLLNNQIVDFDYDKFYEYTDYVFLSGTFIKSSRVPEFKEERFINKAINNLKKHQIDLLIVIGGDGSYHAAYDLMKKQINVICLPATIDNDVASSELSIGYLSALDLILNNIYAIRNTAKSFNSFCLIEVMGRDCNDLSINSTIATFADGIITKQNPWTINDFINKIKYLKSINKNYGLFIVTEKFYGTNNLPTYHELVEGIEKEINVHIKFDSIGYAQRGAKPNVVELINANKMAKYTVSCILRNLKNIAIVWKNNQLDYLTLSEAMKIKKENNIKEIDYLNYLAELNYHK